MNTDEGPKRRLLIGIVSMIVICIVAVFGYVLAGWSWIDACYMVTITIFGVGYGEVHPMNEPGLKLFTICVIFAGCSSLIFVIGGVAQMLAEGEVKRMLGIRNRTKEIDQLRDHTIVCGYGRVGQMLAVELRNAGEAMVVLETSHERVDQSNEDGFLAMYGDASDEQILRKAGIHHAKCLATAIPNDAENVFITLTAREANATIKIIARAESPSTERKLMVSGASKVVMPALIGARYIAQLACCDEDSHVSVPENRFRHLAPTTRGIESAQGESTQYEQIEAELASLNEDVAETIQRPLSLVNDRSPETVTSDPVS